MSRLHLGSFLRAKAKVVALPVLGVLCGVGAAAAITASLTPTYQATASVILLPTPTGNSAEVRLSDVSLAQNLVSSVARLAQSREVAVEVATQLELPDGRVSGHITGVSEPGIQIVKVQATADKPAQAAAIADAAAKAMIKLSNKLTLGGSAVTVQPLDEAGVPTVPIAPRPALDYLLGALVGLLIGVGFATLRNRTGDRFRRVADVETELGLPALGIINRRTPRRRIRSASTLYARAEIGNAVDGLVSALSVLGERSAAGRRIFVTSAAEEDSAAFVAVLLAVGLQQQEHGTALLEAKLRRSAIHRYFPDQPELAVSDVLGRSPLSDAEDAPAVLTLDAINDYFDAPARFDQVGALIDSLAAAGDDVVACAPPVLAGRGLSTLAKHADIVILTVDSDRSRRADAGRAALLVQRLGVPVAGIVVTGSAADEDGWQPSAWPAVVAQPRHAATTGDADAAPVAGFHDGRPARVVLERHPHKSAPPSKTAPPTKSPA